MKRPDSTIGTHSGKVLRMTGDLTGKHPRDSKKAISEVGYTYAGSGYGGYKKTGSEKGGTLRSKLFFFLLIKKFTLSIKYPPHLSFYAKKYGFQDTLYCNLDFIMPIVFGPENFVCFLFLLQIFEFTCDNILSLNF